MLRIYFVSDSDGASGDCLSFLGQLNETLTRERNALTPDGLGGFTLVPTNITFNGRIMQRSAAEIFVGGRESALSEHRLYYPPGTDILSTDFIIDSDGNRYDLGTLNDVQKRGKVGQVDMRLKADKVGA